MTKIEEARKELELFFASCPDGVEPLEVLGDHCPTLIRRSPLAYAAVAEASRLMANLRCKFKPMEIRLCHVRTFTGAILDALQDEAAAREEGT